MRSETLSTEKVEWDRQTHRWYCKEVPNYQHRISRGSLSHTFDGFVANGVREVAAGKSENLLVRFDLSIAPETMDTEAKLAAESGAPRDSAVH
jgi:hypothetical protein